MKRTLQRSGLAIALLGIAFALNTNTASADQRLLLINPGSGSSCHSPTCGIPKLGFYGRITCQGLRVTQVVRGSEAWRIGLEPGDVIVKIDNVRIHDEHDYRFAMRNAGRHIDLLVRDTRGRGLFWVHAHLDGGLYRR
ncbi:PDZ domain-containing protein [Rubinisphaera sp. JC750]|uniref:PDZ domain-containing protein n=1 Tax=Rubinisphaera sp. JC750 TaxID=2898658 RepID=UPI001F3E724E|nr:PDZ domain-containing protein [Rubinisphaera sp. JC750]